MALKNNYYNFTSLGNNLEGSFGGGGGGRSFLTVIVATGILISLSILGNVAVALVTSLRMDRLRRFSSVYVLLRQLAIADLGVSCLFMPAQIGWIRMESRKGESSVVIDMGGCKIFAFLNALSLYLSGLTIASIAMDRFLAVVRPGPRGANAETRAKILGWTAWVFAGIASVPEVLVYHVEVHPFRTWIKKCTNAGAFESTEAKLLYTFSQLLAFPVLPFTITLFCYLRIWQTLSAVANADLVGPDTEIIIAERAKLQILRLLGGISLVFLICWMPYNVMVLWSWSDPENLDHSVLKVPLMMACISPCLNPMIHSYFYMTRQRRQQNSIEMASV